MIMITKEDVKKLNDDCLLTEYSYICERVGIEANRRKQNIEEINKLRDYQKELKDEIKRRMGK